MVTAVALVLLLIGIAASILGTIYAYPPFRRRGNSRFYPAGVWVDPADVLPWGDPRGEVVRGLPDGNGGTYSVTRRRPG